MSPTKSCRKIHEQNVWTKTKRFQALRVPTTLELTPTLSPLFAWDELFKRFPLPPHSPPPPSSPSPAPYPTPLPSTTLVPSRPCEISVDGTPQQTDKRTFHAQSTVMGMQPSALCVLVGWLSVALRPSFRSCLISSNVGSHRSHYYYPKK